MELRKIENLYNNTKSRIATIDSAKQGLMNKDSSSSSQFIFSRRIGQKQPDFNHCGEPEQLDHITGTGQLLT